MTDERKTYPDSRDGLRQMLLNSDASISLYKRHHWDAVIRDVVGPWLDAHDAGVRADERQKLGLSGEAARIEHRAVYPQSLTADSVVVTRSFDDPEDAQGLVDFINARLAGWNLPESAFTETRQLFATAWEKRA